VRIAVACDHRGYDAKRKVVPLLRKQGYDVNDLGCESTASVDYPDFAVLVARGVAAGQYDLGILLDGSGIGMSVAANKVRGVRAGLVHDEVTARRAREHNHCNILCMGTDLLSEDQIRQIIEIFLTTTFEPGRHKRRVEKVCEIEREEYGEKADGPGKSPTPGSGGE
jgi:ribose 5-phosphate isomerase B